jgi:ferritin-like metal-binding protein YciE
MPTKQTIQDLLTEEIKDLYSAEMQLTKALPKMAKGSNDPELRSAFESHLAETENQAARLERAAVILGTTAKGKKCVGMEGCIQEGAEALEGNGAKGIHDLSLVGAATRVENYEMAGYRTAINLAQRMGKDDIVELLEASFGEEQAADQKLRRIASSLM